MTEKCLFFVCLSVCLFIDLFDFFILIILGHPQEIRMKIMWRSDLIWLRYIGYLKNVYLFVCLFVELFIFILIILGHPQEYTLKFRGDPTWFGWDIQNLKNVYSFVCLFVCLSTCLFFILIILEHPQEYTLKISWRLNLVWLRYIGF